MMFDVCLLFKRPIKKNDNLTLMNSQPTKQPTTRTREKKNQINSLLSNPQYLQLVQICNCNKVRCCWRPTQPVDFRFCFIPIKNTTTIKTTTNTMFLSYIYDRIGSDIFFGRGLRSQMSVRLSSPAVTKWLLEWGAQQTAETAAVWPNVVFLMRKTFETL
jgi:hypothetical protein